MNDIPTRHEFESMSGWVKDIDDKMIIHTQQEIRMEQRLEELEKDLKEIKAIVTELRDIWTQSKGAIKFVSLMVSILAVGWTSVVWIKDHIRI